MRIVADSEAAYKQGSQFIDANRDMHTHKKTDQRVVSLFFLHSGVQSAKRARAARYSASN